MWLAVRQALLLCSCCLAFCSRSPQALVYGRALVVLVRGGCMLHTTHAQAHMRYMCYVCLTPHTPRDHSFQRALDGRRSPSPPQALTLQRNQSHLHVEGQQGRAPAQPGEQKLLLCVEIATVRVPRPGFKQRPCTTELRGPRNLFPRCLCLRYPSLSSACLVGL